MLSDFEIQIYEALSKTEPRDAEYVSGAIGRSRNGSGNRMKALAERGYLVKTKRLIKGTWRPHFTLTDAFSMAYSEATGREVELSESTKAMLWMRSNKLSKVNL